MLKLYQCPYNKATKCNMSYPCLGCEQFDSSGETSKNIDWVKLRTKFFVQCTDQNSHYKHSSAVNMPKIILAPHDLFEWFKREICCFFI